MVDRVPGALAPSHVSTYVEGAIFQTPHPKTSIGGRSNGATKLSQLIPGSKISTYGLRSQIASRFHPRKGLPSLSVEIRTARGLSRAKARGPSVIG
jgi:hypothetical protein